MTTKERQTENDEARPYGGPYMCPTSGHWLGWVENPLRHLSADMPAYVYECRHCTHYWDTDGDVIEEDES